MKKIYLILLAAAGILAAASCAREEIVDPSQAQKPASEATTLTVAFDEGKTALVDGKTYWVKGDVVRIYNSTGSFYNDVEIPEEADGQKAFECNVDFKDTTYFAVYPTESAAGVADKKVKVKIPSDPDGLFASANICAAETKGTTLSMRNVTAILKVDVNSGNVIEFLQVASKNNMTGTYSVSFEGEAPALTATSGSRSATLAVGGIDAVYYLPVAPGDYLAEFAMTALRGNGGYQTLKTTQDNEVKVNTIVDLGTIGGTLSTGLEGEGTEANPYIISNLGEWTAFSASVNLGNHYADKFVNLTFDVDDAVTTPVGYWLASDDQAYFGGTFLGNNHTIKVALDGANCKAQTYVALFGVVDEGATIKDLKVTGTATATGNYTSGVIGYVRGTSANKVTVSNCTNEVTVTSTGDRVGGVIGYANYATVENCVNNGLVTGRNCVAGISGKASNTTFKDCSNTVAIKSTGTDTGVQIGFNGSILTHGTSNGAGVWDGTIGSNATGGICGFIDHGSLTSCTNSGKVDGYVKLAGIVGGTYWSSVYSCVNTGNITASYGFVYNLASAQGYGYGSMAGGIVGWMHANGTISDCQNSGVITGKGGQGGILGYGSCNNNASSGITVKDCKNTGAVTATGVTTGGSIKNHNPAVGGVVGSVVAFGPQLTNILNCTNTGNVSSSAMIAGGIVGRVQAPRSNGSAVNLVDKCVNTGNVTATYWVGGICGMALAIYNGVIRVANSYNEGTVTGNRTDDAGEVAGGILGANHVWYSYTCYGQVHNSYNAGKVVYDAVAHTKPYCGGIAGRLVSAGDIKNVCNYGTVGPKEGDPVAAAAARLGAVIGSLETSNPNYLYYLDGTCAQIVGTSSTKTTFTIGGNYGADYKMIAPVTINDDPKETVIDALNAWVTGDYSKWKVGTNGPVFNN